MRLLIAAAACLILGKRLAAQNDSSNVAAHMHDGVSQHSMLNMPPTRTGSGTSWIPDSSPMRMVGRRVGSWTLLIHGSAYLTYNRQQTKRGDIQLAATDWEMLMAVRNVGRGKLQLRAMTSLEPLTLRDGGYPLLLQSGGSYRHAYLHDRQHPHNAVVELAAYVEQPVLKSFTTSLYVGAVGEPASGPPAFMHRPSAQSDPFAPLSMHWQDASHQTFGVATVGIGTRRVKLEGSLFNPREPDEHHRFMDYRDARLDSYAGRLTVSPNAHIAASAWWAYLNSHNRLDPSARMHRYGASVLLDTRGLNGGRWSSALVWGMNLHHHGGSSHLILHGGPGASPHHHAGSVLGESNFQLGRRTTVFGRWERVTKNGEELGFLGGDLTALYDVRSVVLGVSRDIVRLRSTELSLGARGAVNFVPQSLFATYGTRRPTGFAVFARVRPTLHNSTMN